MSVGCFLGIRASYIEGAQHAASAFLAAINAAMSANLVPGYVDPDQPPDVYSRGLFGRSALDHHSARCLAGLAELAIGRGEAPNLALLATNPYRVVFLPADFEPPLPTGYAENIAGNDVDIWVGSAPRLVEELAATASLLGIPLVGGCPSDAVAQKINEFAPLYAGDDCSMAEDERTAWLLLYEGARLAVLHGVALSLAG